MDEDELIDDDTVVDEVADDVEEVTLPSLTYRVVNGHVIGKVDEYEAMVQAVDKIMKTERFVFPIYSDQYGNDFNELLGKDFDYAKVEVERMLEEALLADERIEDVTVDTIEQTDATALSVTATIETIYGVITVEKEVQAGES